MRPFPRPIVAVSRCLEFAACRYNGQMISCPVVRELKPFVDFKPVCPEVEIGLGVPRDPIRIVLGKDGRSLIQPNTGRDLTSTMAAFVQQYLAKVGDIDGFILKSRSPSCGIKDVKIYPSGTDSTALPTDKGAGFFASAVLERCAGLSVEDEGRLEHDGVREHFLTKLFTLADFRQVTGSGAISKLIEFQSRHQLLLMAYSQKELRALGKIVANTDDRPWHGLIADYRAHLHAALARMPRATSHISVLQHALGYFKAELSSAEQDFFLDQLTEYRRERLSLSAVIAVMRSWIVRFKNDYLGMQTYFEPYPEQLSAVADSGQGREY